MNHPYDIDSKAFNFNPINGSKWYSISFQWWFAKESNYKNGLNPMIKDPSFCMFAAKSKSFWQAFYCFDAASMILERWFWWLQLYALFAILTTHWDEKLELLELLNRLAFYYQFWWTLCRSYIKLPLHSLFYSIGIWILTNTKESRSFRLFMFSSNNENGLSVMINSERSVKITQSLIEESLALWMDCIVLSKENEDYRVFNWY